MYQVQCETLWCFCCCFSLGQTPQTPRPVSRAPFVFPYHLGYRRNFTQVINWSGRCRGNGLEWEVAEGCFEISLTSEQLEQKKLKRKQVTLSSYTLQNGTVTQHTLYH